MSQASGETVASKQSESLAALLSSLASKAKDQNTSDVDQGKLIALAKQLEGLLDATPISDPALGDDGKIVNEDGEPVIEITEEVDENEVPTRQRFSIEPSIPLEMSEAEKIRLKKERDAILDLLEAEEEEEARREQEELQTRHSGDSKKQTIPPTLIQNKTMSSTTTSQNAQTPSSALTNTGPLQSSIKPTSSSSGTEGVSSPSKKKNVSFTAETIISSSQTKTAKESIGVTSAKTAPSSKNKDKFQRDPTKAHDSLRAIKMDVVERGQQVSSSPSTSVSTISAASAATQNIVESDDELEDEDLDLGSELDEDDWDEAMLQREVALEYVKQKGFLKEARASAVPPSPRQTLTDPGSWDQPYVPLDANLASSKQRSAQSKFISERTQEVRSRFQAPTPADPFLAASIQYGRVDESGQLVAGDDEYDDDELNEEGRRIVELLTRGEGIMDPSAFMNAGPSYSGPPVLKSSARQTASPRDSGNGSTPAGKKTSRFKTERGDSTASPTPFPTPILKQAYTSTQSERKNDPIKTQVSPSIPQLVARSQPAQTLRSPPKLPLFSGNPVQPPSKLSNSAPIFPSGGFTSVVLTPEDASKPTQVPPLPTVARRAPPPMAMAVTERAAPVSQPSENITEPKRVSRFKAERS